MSAVVDQELRKHLELARRKDERARVFAFHDDRKRSWPDTLEHEGAHWRIVRAESELAIRAALVDHDDESLLAIVTPLRTSELARDVRARIANYQLFAFDPWESLLGPFKATAVDGRLRRNGGLGRALLRCSTSSGFRPAATGVLSADEAWGAYFSHVLGLDDEPTELDGWVQWFIDHPSETATLLGGDDELGHQVLERAATRCGAAVKLAFRLASGAVDEGADLAERFHAVAHGVLAALAAGTNKTAMQFLTRLESYFGGEPAPESELRDFAEEVLRTDAGGRDIAARLDALLETEHATSLAIYSDISLLGYRDRRRALSEQCRKRVADKATRDDVVGSFRLLERHRDFRAEDSSHRERVKALAQLADRMGDVGRTKHPSGLAGLAVSYIEEQSFIDALRERVELGDLGNDFADAVTEVLQVAGLHARSRNAHFAKAVVAAVKHAPMVPGAFFVQQMLEVAVAPLVKERAVLLLVLDGLSWFVLRQLTLDPAFASSKWLAVAPASDGRLLPMLATVPSVTTFSRCSLLTGELQSGGQNVESKGFVNATPLIHAMSNKHRAVLFHKAELDASGPGKVGDAVRLALADARNRVVGVVINGIDDNLSGAPQLASDWRIETVSPLRSLLELAEETSRDVLIVSDHGHIWDNGASSKSADGESARHRTGSDASDGEVVVRGPMVEAFGVESLIVPYDESIRYKGGQRGYHGGASLQELVAPCVLLTLGDAPDSSRWTQLKLEPPAWWEFREQEATVHSVHPPEPPPVPDQQLSLIDRPPQNPPVASWLAALLDSSVFEQRRAAIPAAPEAERVAAVLATLHANGGRAHVNTLVEVVNMPAARVIRLISTLQRLLNVDGFAVLDLNRQEQLLRLDLDLLKKQFHLE